MLASVDHRFVLLCSPKAGSSALSRAYRPYANFDLGRGDRWKHLSWVEYRSIFGDFFEQEGCDTFAVVRDPIDLLVSWWRFRQRPRLQSPKHPNHHNSTVGVSFEQFVDEWSSPDPPSRSVIIEQRDVLADSSGSPAPIRYFVYDRIGALVSELNGRIGTEVELQQVNVSPDIDIVVDRAWLLDLPAMRPHVEFYQRAVDQTSN